jgi:CheY-like chemotaxis protein
MFPSILVVEDDPSLRLMIVLLLEQRGYQAEAAASAREALAKASDAEFDLIITDHFMPGMTGVELARALHEAAPRSPVLLLTGRVDAVAVPEGVAAVLRKPIGGDELTAAVERGLEVSRQRKSGESRQRPGD